MTELNFTVEFNDGKYTPHSKDKEWANINRTPVTANYSSNIEIFHSSGDNRRICILGTPILNERIDNQEFAKEYLSRPADHDFFRKINGEFLIIEADEKLNLIRVVNSRFASPLFWYVSEKDFFLGGISYYHLCARLNQLGQLHFIPEHFYEFLNYRRLFGDKTYDNKSRYLRPASVLEFSDEKCKIVPYWQLNYEKADYSIDDNAERIIGAVKTSIKRKTSDNKRYGLLLSGGMDTRTVLAHFAENPPHCFTLSYSESSREYQVAKKLAHWKNAEHTWIQIHRGHDRKFLDEDTKLTGAMYMVPALFSGHREVIQKHADVVFSGHGFDYFFQGMYLPVKAYKILGRPSCYRRLNEIKSDIVDYFIDNISYYTKGLPIIHLLKNSRIPQMNEYIRDVISNLVSEGKAIANNTFDLWEYLTFGDLSRHYTYGDQLQMMTLASYRAISYDNDIYDIYLQLPPKQRFDGKILKRVLKKVNPYFYNYISANHGLPIRYSFAQRTLHEILTYPKRKIFGKRFEPVTEQNIKRTWLPMEYVLRNELSDQIESLKGSEELNSLGLFDMDKIRTNIQLWKESKIVGDQSFFVLLIIDRYLKSLAGSMYPKQ